MTGYCERFLTTIWLQEAAGGATFVAGLTENASGPECESGTDGEGHPDGADPTECDAAGAEVALRVLSGPL